MIRHPLAWLTWALAALAAAFVQRNPFLQALLILVLLNVLLPYRRGRPGLARLGLLLGLLPILFSLALSRFGRHVIFTAPPLPVLGGPWTWEAVAFGASSGAALLLTVAVFAVLQSTVRSADLLPMLPSWLYRAGTAVALALAFAPKTLASFDAIQEARRFRGQRAGWRAAPAILVPLLATTLERALQYGESLDARGFGSRRRTRYRPVAWAWGDRIVALAALLALTLVFAAPAGAYDAYADLVPRAPSAGAVLAVLLLAVPAAWSALAPRTHAAHHA